MMDIILVDDEKNSLLKLEYICGNLPGVNSLFSFINPYDALHHAHSHNVHMAFLDIELPGITGIELSQRLRTLYPDIIIVFVTGFDQYALRAFQVDAFGYILKPYPKEEVEAAIQRAEKIIGVSAAPARRIFMRTFGYFDMFVGDQLVRFSSAKAKELLALLVCRRGGSVTMEEAITVLWEDRPYNKQAKGTYRKAMMNLRETLRTYSAGDILIDRRGWNSVDTTKFRCDYYDLLAGDQEAIQSFAGELCFSYSWSEPILAMIGRKLGNMASFY